MNLDEVFCASAVYEAYDDNVFGEQGTEQYERLRDAWAQDMDRAADLGRCDDYPEGI